MKKYLLSISIIASLLLVSCNKTSYPEQGPAEPEVVNGAFFLPSDAKAGINPSEFSLDANATSFTYYIGRNSTSGSATVAIENQSDPIFTVPSSVTFADGKDVAELVVSFSDVPATGAAIKMRIAEANAAIYSGAYPAFEGSLNKLWESLGYGQIFDQLVLTTSTDDQIQKVQILKSRIEEKYRVVEPYANQDALAASWGSDCLGGQPCPYIEFWEYKGSDGNTYLTWNKFWYSTLLYQGGAGNDIKGYLPSALSSSQAAKDALSRWYDTKVAGLYPYWYIDGLGGFGTYPVFISLPGGPDLNKWLYE